MQSVCILSPRLYLLAIVACFVGIANAGFLRSLTSVRSSNGPFIDFKTANGMILANNQEFIIKGANWFGFETTDQVIGGLKKGLKIDEAMRFLKEHKFNALRLPFSVDTVLSNPIPSAETTGWQPELQHLTMLEIMDRVVDSAARHGILIMFDFHRLRADDIIPELWHDSQTTLQHVKDAWQVLAQRYCGSWNVFAADLKNEPHGSAEWGTGGWKDWRLGAQDLGNHVLYHCPRWLVVIEGVEKNIAGEGNRQGWWGGLLQGVKQNPIVLSNNDRLVYSPHIYGPGVYMQTTFKEQQFPANMKWIWDNDFGFITRTLQKPIVIGEWGGFYADLDKTWQDAVINYLVQNRVSFFYWCLNPDSVDTGGLYRNDWKTPSFDKLHMLAPAHSSDVSALYNHIELETRKSIVVKLFEILARLFA